MQDFEAALRYEMLEEGASALGRIGRRLEFAAIELRKLAPELAESSFWAGECRELAWEYIVQRESMGLTEHDAALAHYRLPGYILSRMGPQ